MMNEEKAATDFVRFVSFLHSAFFLLHFDFRMSLLTSLRTRRYDPAGVGCYDFGHVLHATFGIKSELIGIKSFAAGGSFVKLP